MNTISRNIEDIDRDSLALHPLVAARLKQAIAEKQRALKSCSPEELSRIQGQLSAFEDLAGWPEKIWQDLLLAEKA